MLLSIHLGRSLLSFVLFRALCVLEHRMCLRLGFFRVQGGLDYEYVCYPVGVGGWEGLDIFLVLHVVSVGVVALDNVHFRGWERALFGEDHFLGHVGPHEEGYKVGIFGQFHGILSLRWGIWYQMGILCPLGILSVEMLSPTLSEEESRNDSSFDCLLPCEREAFLHKLTA